MKIKLEYLTKIKNITGVGSDEYEVKSPISIKDLFMKHVTVKHNNLSEFLYDQSGKPNQLVIVFVSDNTFHIDDEYVLEDDCKVTCMTPVVGG